MRHSVLRVRGIFIHAPAPNILHFLSLATPRVSRYIKIMKEGDKVNKVTGYRFPGTVVSVFKTLKGETRVVVEMDEYGLLHIFNEGQLTVVH